MNKLLLCSLSIFLFFSCNIMSHKFIIEGELTGLQAGDSLFFSYRDANFEAKTDTCVTHKNNHFHFEKSWEEPTIFTLKSKKSATSLVIVAEKKAYTYLKGTLNNLSKVSIYTYKQQKIQQEWERVSAATQEQIYEMQVKIDAAGLNGDMVEQKKCLEEYENVLKKQKREIIEFALLHSNSIVSASLAARYLEDEEDLKSLEKLYGKFSYSIQGGKYGRQIKRIITNLKRTAIGEKAPDFSLKDSSNQKVLLANFQGKYILLDFWASWCVPCRRENPLLKELYEKYHEKGLEIIGISLDKDRKNWVNAIKTDKISWIQVTDFKANESEVVKLYDIKSIPSNFLLDTQGKIVAKNLQGEDLRRKLASLIQ